MLEGGFQHVLPGASGGGIAQGDGLPGSQGRHGIGHDPVGGPVAADQVSGAVGIVAALPKGEQVGQDEEHRQLGALAIHIGGYAGQRMSLIMPGQLRQHPGVGAQGIAIEAGGASGLQPLEVARLGLFDAAGQVYGQAAGVV